jgi:hypothetical protein
MLGKKMSGHMHYQKYLTSSKWFTPWITILLEKLRGHHLLKEFPAFYSTRRFMTAFTITRNPFRSWVRSIQSMPHHPTSLRPILILSSHLRLGLPGGLFPLNLFTKPLQTTLLSPHTCYMPAQLILLGLIT